MNAMMTTSTMTDLQYAARQLRFALDRPTQARLLDCAQRALDALEHAIEVDAMSEAADQEPAIEETD